jgi:hypothetical protein
MPAAISITCLDYTAAELRREAKRTDDADAARRMALVSATAAPSSGPTSSPARASTICRTHCCSTGPKDT